MREMDGGVEEREREGRRGEGGKTSRECGREAKHTDGMYPCMWPQTEWSKNQKAIMITTHNDKAVSHSHDNDRMGNMGI